MLNDYLAGGRRTHPVAPLAGLNWLFLSQGGRTWPVREVRRWFARAGLREIVLEPAPMITTLVYGRRRPGQRPVL